MFSNNEKTYIVLIYGEAWGNSAEAKRLYMELIYGLIYGQRVAPNAKTFVNIDQHLCDHGIFKKQSQNCGLAKTHPILDAYRENNGLNREHFL